MSIRTVINIQSQTETTLNWHLAAENIYKNADPYAAITSGRLMARAWAKTLNASDHLALIQNFVFHIMESYWNKMHEKQLRKRALPQLFKEIPVKKLDNAVRLVAEAIGSSAANLTINQASYLLGNVYTAVLPENMRTTGGMFYTPPALTARLISLAEQNGVNWATAKVIDPACGGGAFLAPVTLKILRTIKTQKASDVIAHIQSHLVGWEIDPFGGWLTQVFIEAVLRDVLQESTIELSPLVKICNSLEEMPAEDVARFDLVIGNPPYGKLKLTDQIRKNFSESLYGHPNLYGLFTHLALRLATENAIIAYLTPTSFLSGEYFKNLRAILRKLSTPLEMDFVAFRKGVFDDVLQETMLALYLKKPYQFEKIKINQITTTSGNGLHIRISGKFGLSQQTTTPWMFPRMPEQALCVNAMKNMPCKLQDWGYQVSTGPLVWNRHKPQLGGKKKGKHCFPIIWSESVTQDGRFILKAEKRNHSPYFTFHSGDEWLITKKPCILLQRTTAKEQDKRLIAASLPVNLLKKGVVIENHLNMITAINDKPLVAPSVLAVFLNSRAVNEAFRTISGSVAVSAYELESMPLPIPAKLDLLTKLLEDSAHQSDIEKECQQIYASHR